MKGERERATTTHAVTHHSICHGHKNSRGGGGGKGEEGEEKKSRKLVSYAPAHGFPYIRSKKTLARRICLQHEKKVGVMSGQGFFFANFHQTRHLCHLIQGCRSDTSFITENLGLGDLSRMHQGGEEERGRRGKENFFFRKKFPIWLVNNFFFSGVQPKW